MTALKQLNGRVPKDLSIQKVFDALPIARPHFVTQLEPGSFSVEVDVISASWLVKWLRAPATLSRRFDLDSIGYEIFSKCDGNKSVSVLIEEISEAHLLHHQQAEIAVMSFLRTLVTKGLVVMAIPEGLHNELKKKSQANFHRRTNKIRGTTNHG